MERRDEAMEDVVGIVCEELTALDGPESSKFKGTGVSRLSLGERGLGYEDTEEEEEEESFISLMGCCCCCCPSSRAIRCAIASASDPPKASIRDCCRRRFSARVCGGVK